MNHIQKTRAQFFAGVLVLVVALFSAHFVFAETNIVDDNSRNILSGQVASVSSNLITVTVIKGKAAKTYTVDTRGAKITKTVLRGKKNNSPKKSIKLSQKNKIVSVRVGDAVQIIGNETGDMMLDADRIVIKGSKIKSNN